MKISTESQPKTQEPRRALQPTLEELSLNARLLIRLRWVAGFGILIGTLFVSAVLGLDLQVAPLLVIGLSVLAYNTALSFVSHNDIPRAGFERIAWGQILLDWLAMIALVHFTGGITSPALIYFVLHAALSGMILLPWQVRSLTVLAILIVGGLAWLERAGWLPHVAIDELNLHNNLHENTTYIAAVMFFFGSTMFVLSELVTRIVQRLRQREEHIRQLLEARSTFVRVATHELRAPLAAGLSLMKNIEQGYAGELTEQQMALILRVISRLEGLRTLIDDLLTLARSREATAAHAPLEPDSVRAMLVKIIERETPNAEHKRIALHSDLSDDPGVIMAGPIGLQIILGNLLNNAIKYTPEGGDVWITYEVSHLAHTVEVTIADSGIGIPAADMSSIFNEFFRARNAKETQITGTGIGLSTVKTLVDRYRGVLTLESEEGKGTAVTVKLPLISKQTPREPL
ncbi:MAG: HAMP domain-containing histidine kinase [Anaerolineae bacterium]|nr:HAMP domain-containing histidine kinase [Anaerolineae bacterium]